MERLAPEQLNPILDPGSPSSFAGFQTAKAFADTAGIEFYPEPAVTTRYHAFGPEGGGGGRVSHVWRCLVEDVLGRLLCLRWICCQGQTHFFLGWTKIGMLTHSARKHQHFGYLTLTANVMPFPFTLQGIAVAVYEGLWNFGSGRRRCERF
jgi:hypothetical protein